MHNGNPMQPINRIITPQNELEMKVADLLGKVKDLLPGHAISLICRNPNKANSDILMSEETDLSHLIGAINKLKEQQGKMRTYYRNVPLTGHE